MSDKSISGLVRRCGLNILLGLLITASFSTQAAALASQSQSAQITSNDELSRMYRLVYDGRFDELDTLISQNPKADEQSVVEIAAVAREYDELEQRREQAKEKSYQEKWGRLQAMKWADVNDPNAISSIADVNLADMPLPETAEIFIQWLEDENIIDFSDAFLADLNKSDVNNVKDPAEVFSLAFSLIELAEPQQKEEILNTPIVQQAIKRAITVAQEYESQGKWFDSYSNAWYWLSVLDKDNEQYKEHAEELVEKVTILSTFQDSPCETSRQRFERVDPSMYKRAIEVIDTTYVNPMFIDYSKMSEKIIRRAKLMAQVIDVSYDQIEESYKNNGQQDAFEIVHRPDSSSLKAWNEALDALASDIKQSTEGISRERYLNLFDQVLVLNSMTVSMPKSILIAQMTQASFSVLDPHTMIVWPQDVEDFKKDLTGEFSGIGIIISKDKGLLTAASLLPDTPAYKSGLDAGDIIEAVDGVPTKDMSLECAVKYITGAAGTTVNLTVRTPGDDKSRELSI
ncbi:MAG: PDZ domain-containing protein, partial [Phycisphaerae bacterium]